MNAQILITVVAGLFILPFFLFSATAGQLADKYEKSFLIRIVKFVEIILMCMTAVAFQYLNLFALVILLFFMGAQSAFFGPLKYSILPQHLEEDELVAGNGLVSAGTYIAILTGTLFGGLLILHSFGRVIISTGVVSVAVLGFITSLFIPKALPPDPEVKIDWNIPKATWEIISYVKVIKPVFRSILGISWFWFLGAVFLAQFPTFAKDVLGGNEQVSTLFLIVFSVGVGFGSTICNRILKGRISMKLVAPACVGLSLSTLLLYTFSLLFKKGDSLVGALVFLQDYMSWGIVLSLFLLAAFGGIYSVPMYALMQSKCPDEHRARSVAVLNITDSFAMVLSAFFVTGLLFMEMSIINIFLVLGIMNLFVTPLLSRMVGAYVD